MGIRTANIEFNRNNRNRKTDYLTSFALESEKPDYFDKNSVVSSEARSASQRSPNRKPIRGGKTITESEHIGLRLAEGEINQVYNSAKDSPNFPKRFKAIRNGKQKYNVNNNRLLEKLRKIESGEWKKVYSDGYDGNGNMISIHYFESSSRKVFDIEVKSGWSNLEEEEFYLWSLVLDLKIKMT